MTGTRSYNGRRIYVYNKRGYRDQKDECLDYQDKSLIKKTRWHEGQQFNTHELG